MAKTYEQVSVESDRAEQPSGIPGARGLSASRNEVVGLILALLVFAAITVGFWYEATR